MKKFLGLFLIVGMITMLSGCYNTQKRAGYVSKYPNHDRHACEH